VNGGIAGGGRLAPAFLRFTPRLRSLGEAPCFFPPKPPEEPAMIEFLVERTGNGARTGAQRALELRKAIISIDRRISGSLGAEGPSCRRPGGGQISSNVMFCSTRVIKKRRAEAGDGGRTTNLGTGAGAESVAAGVGLTESGAS